MLPVARHLVGTIVNDDHAHVLSPAAKGVRVAPMGHLGEKSKVEMDARKTDEHVTYLIYPRCIPIARASHRRKRAGNRAADTERDCNVRQTL